MKLLPKHIERTLPPLHSQEPKGWDAIALVKFFAPWSRWTWYASEYDPKRRLFLGLVVGQEAELEYFGLDELEAVRGPGSLRIVRIERDVDWSPRPLRECREAGAAADRTLSRAWERYSKPASSRSGGRR